MLANDAIDLEIRAGETHVLLGENGAGKSTLISILSGMLVPDAGRVRIQGEETEVSSPREALELGIGTVYQHLTLVPTLSVLENLVMGPSDRLRLDFESARRRFEELAGMLGVTIDPDAVVGGLALGEQQQVEIIKALWRRSRLLILDEPTSMLTPQGVEELGRELARLKASGLAVIFITHKLHEAIAMGDRVTVLRAGRVVGAIGPAELRGRSSEAIAEEIVGLMFGEAAAEVADAAEVAGAIGSGGVEGGGAAGRGPAVAAAPATPTEPTDAAGGEAALELREVSVPGDRDHPGLHDVELTLRHGEVLGVAGIDGNGQRELAEVIAGQRRPGSGEVRLDGEAVTGLGVAERQTRGLRYVTDDRLGEGTVGDLDVALNMVLKRIGEAPFWRRGRVRREEIDRLATDLTERFDLRTPSVHSRVATLSGGNAQKLILARELSFDPRVVVFSKPTHGLDVRTAEFVRDRIRDLARRGAASLLISTEIDELLELCDRIAVLSRGRLTGVVENGPRAGERIGALMVA